MVNDSEQSAITAAAAAATTTTVEPGVERGRASGSGRRLAEESSNEEERSQRFSDAEDRSWHSHSRQGSASTPASIGCDAGASAGGGGAAERPRKSCVSECSLDDVVDLEAGLAEITKASPDKAERNCRICHLGLDSAAAESGAGIVLGCSCKNDLSRAHKQCAETWFKIRGNKICEICGSAACNVAGFSDMDFIEQWNESSSTAAAQATASEPRRFWQGHRFLNFLLACMVFAFVISWLFHFNVPG
ncbi:hypothetical protein SEVIR_5G387800v4 [Setaria viridis]|uniref:RING-CH-type domain-containing protein n=1 Tax=Setaria viridis TaxID=4556 RepID=A0A4U6UN30_SETVI|nr:uncharacterized protein LOC117858955 isoform X1 [Setaria viridis]TKW17740.1 hypothetical protein SEVIR_5G387800v2 [Setaria viridis]